MGFVDTFEPNLVTVSRSIRNTMPPKIPKICTGCRVSHGLLLRSPWVSAAIIYLYHSTKIAKARPHSVECQTDSPEAVVHASPYQNKNINRGISGRWAGWPIAHPVFGRIEGTAGQWQRATLQLAHLFSSLINTFFKSLIILFSYR